MQDINVDCFQQNNRHFRYVSKNKATSKNTLQKMLKKSLNSLQKRTKKSTENEETTPLSAEKLSFTET